jgi:hypothetical protein
MAAMFRLFGYVLLFFAGAAVLIFAAVTILEQAGATGGGAFATLLITTLVAIVAAFIPFLNFAMKRTLVFEPVLGATPLGEEALRDEIMAINGYTVPIAVDRRGNRLVIGWRYVDGEVWGILAKQRLKQTYELHVRLDGARREAILTDVKKSVRWGVGPDAVRLGLGYTRGFLIGVEIGKAWGIRRDLSIRKAWDYRFDPEEIKGPVVATITQAGWTARHAMW